MQEYSVIWRIKLNHPYYKGGECAYFDLIPTARTAARMVARGVFLKKMGVATWGIIGTAEVLLDDEDLFEFDVYFKNRQFLYITDNAGSKTGECPLIEMNGSESTPFVFSVSAYPVVNVSPGVIARIILKLHAGGKGGEASHELNFRVPERYLEYIFLSRSGGADKELLLEDVDRKITFSPGEKIDYMGRTGYRFRSTEKLLLAESPDIRLQLLELFGTNRRVIVKRLPYPEIGMFIDAPSDVLRAVYYI